MCGVTGDDTASGYTTLRKVLPLFLKPRNNWFQAERQNDRSSSKRDCRQTPSSALVHKKLISAQELFSDISGASSTLSRQTDMAQLMLPRAGSGAESRACSSGLSRQAQAPDGTCSACFLQSPLLVTRVLVTPAFRLCKRIYRGRRMGCRERWRTSP